MTGKDLKRVAEKIPDEAVVCVRLGAGTLRELIGEPTWSRVKVNGQFEGMLLAVEEKRLAIFKLAEGAPPTERMGEPEDNLSRIWGDRG